MSDEPKQWMKDISMILVDAMQCAIMAYKHPKFQEMTSDQQVSVMTEMTKEFALTMFTVVEGQLKDRTSSS
jgi:ferritin-like protein